MGHRLKWFQNLLKLPGLTKESVCLNFQYPKEPLNPIVTIL